MDKELDPKTEEILEACAHGDAEEATRKRMQELLRASPQAADYFNFLKGLSRAAGLADVEKAPASLKTALIETLSPKTISQPVLRWAPVAASALLFFLIGIFAGRATKKDLSQQEPLVQVQFHLEAPAARSVSLAGDFTGWKSVAMRKSNGAWIATVKVPQGSHQYLFILNGEVFVVDPASEKIRQDSLGNFVSILEIRAAQKRAG